MNHIDPSANSPITIAQVREALQYNDITSKIAYIDSSEYISFNYKDFEYRLNCNDLPFVSVTMCFEYDPEKEDVELMKDAAQYVSVRSCGAVVFVVPEYNYWFAGYDIFADTSTYLKENLLLFLEHVGYAAGYFYEYYENRKSKHSKR